MEQTRLDHIKELRKRMLWVSIPALAIFVLLFFNYPTILSALGNYYDLPIINLTPTESLNTGVNFSLAGTLVFLLPAIVFQVLAFSKEIIPHKQYKKICTYGIFGGLFGLFGFILGVTYFSKLIFSGLMQYTIGESMWSISSVLGSAVIFGATIAIGIQSVWAIPTLSKVGLYSKEQLIKFRPIIFLGLLGVSAFLTPPDILSQFIMMLPLYGSFEIGLFLTKSNKEVTNARNE